MKKSRELLTLIVFLALSTITQGQTETKSENISIDWMNQLNPIERGMAKGQSIAVDMNGNVHTASLFGGSIELTLMKLDEEDEYTIKETTHLKSMNFQDGVVCKYKPSGELLWATQIQSTFIENILIGIRFNQIFVAGTFKGDLIYIVDGEEKKLTSTGKGMNAFVLHLNEKGDIQWATKFGGDESKLDIEAIQIGSNNSLFLTGKFKGKANFSTVEYMVKNRPELLTSDGVEKPTYDGFLLKLDYGGKCKWVKQVASPSYTNIQAILHDENYVYIGGYFKESAKFSDDESLKAEGNMDAFVAKYNEDGTLIWVKSIGGPGEERVRSLAINEKHELIIGGEFSTKEEGLFYKMKTNGSTNGFLMTMDTDGNLLWSVQIENELDVTVSAIDTYSDGNILVVGNVRHDMGTTNMYFSTFNNLGELVSESNLEQRDVSPVDAVISDSGDAFVLGKFSKKMTIDQDTLVSQGAPDAFLLKLK